MDLNVRISNSNMVMGNIREMSSDVYRKEQDNKETEALFDILFGPKRDSEGFYNFLEA